MYFNKLWEQQFPAFTGKYCHLVDTAAKTQLISIIYVSAYISSLYKTILKRILLKFLLHYSFSFQEQITNP